MDRELEVIKEHITIELTKVEKQIHLSITEEDNVDPRHAAISLSIEEFLSIIDVEDLENYLDKLDKCIVDNSDLEDLENIRFNHPG